MIVVDSSVWIDYFGQVDKPHTTKLQSILGVEQIAVGDLIMTEVLQGYSRENEFDAALKVLTGFDLIVVGGQRVSIESAKNYVRLRSLGFTVRKTIDALIATRCILSGYKLLHNDRDFLPFEKHLGLKCVH
ncbi:MAG: PIN domain nuclease [Chloracidobacterium sp.]|nr:PIN domain nuclease [Chloracidobacterium sp.]